MRQLIFGLILTIAAVVFAMQNSNLVTIRLFFWDLPGTSMAVILLFTLLGGALIALFITVPGIFRRNKIVDAQKKRITALEKQISDHMK